MPSVWDSHQYQSAEPPAALAGAHVLLTVGESLLDGSDDERREEEPTEEPARQCLFPHPDSVGDVHHQPVNYPTLLTRR